MEDSTKRFRVEESNGLDIRRLIGLVRERMGLIAMCLLGSVLVGVLAGLGYLSGAAPVYEATVMVEVPRQTAEVVNVEPNERQDLRGDEVLKTIEQNLQRISLFQRVMAREDIRMNEGIQHSLDQPFDRFRPGELAQMLKDWTRVRLKRGTRLIAITVEHCDPGAARELADAIVGEFLQETAEVSSGASDSTLEFLLSEAEGVRAKLQDSEDKLLKIQQFREALALKEKIETQEHLVMELSQRYRDKHPNLVQARSSLAALKERLRAELLPAQERLGEAAGKDAGWDGNSYARVDDERLEAELNLLEAQFNVLEREVETDRALYQAIVGRINEASVTSHWNAAPFEVVESAYVPSDPSKPKRMRVVGFSAVLGGGLGLGLFWVLFATDISLRSVSEAERVTGLPVLGALPDGGRLSDLRARRGKSGRLLKELLEEYEKSRKTEGEAPVRARRGRGRTDPLLMLSDRSAPIPDAIRTLRAALTANGHRKTRKTILITSAMPGEGKSLIAANLAIAFAAEEGQRTLLIDANLRRPMAASLFDADPWGESLVAALAGRSDVKAPVLHSGIRELDLMLPEKTPANAAELLSGDCFGQILEIVSSKYDRIIIDGANVNTVSDALLVAPNADATILVARAARTPRDAVLRACDLLSVMGCKPAGLVLNGIPAHARFAGERCG